MNAIDVRGYADFARWATRFGSSRRGKGCHRVRIIFRNGEKDMTLLARSRQALGQAHSATRRQPSQPGRARWQLLFNEPKYIRFDDGAPAHAQSNGLKLVSGVRLLMAYKTIVEDVSTSWLRCRPGRYWRRL